jgi:autotransporter-associated beta strand protein
MQQGDVFGSATTVPVATLVVNAGATVINNGNNFNTFGPIQLNGGTLATSGGAIAGYQSYNLLGTVTVGGSSPSSITVSGAGNAFNGYHLDTSTTFTVADATGDSAADLVVTAPLIDRNASLTGAGGLYKSGPGTMSIQTAATYTGDTQVQEGVLRLEQASLADGADVRMIASGKLNLAYTGTDTVRAFYIDDQLQFAGVWGAIGSGAQYETAALTGTGTLTVTSGATPPGYTSWALDNGLTAGVNDGSNADPDQDGLVNLLEYVLGGNPLGSSPSIAPVAGPNGASFVLTFKRLDLSETDTTVTIQWSTDLGSTWSDFVTLGAESAGAVTIVENGAGLDDVTVAIPLSNAVNGKLFARIKTVK